MLYKLEKISKTYQTDKGIINALNNISFTISQGEFVVLVGPSGCGKTTLLKILAYLIKPTSGKISFQNGEKTAKKNIGFVFQEPTLMPWRTVLKNIILPLEMQHKQKDLMFKQATNLLKIVNLQGCEDYYPYQLSGGMGQRVAIARALINDPMVLLMDEPFGALDEMLRLKLNFELLNIKKKTRKTIIFVTHSIFEAVILADRIIILGQTPNTIRSSLKINFPKRNSEMINHPLFYQYVRQVRKLMGETN